MHFAALLTLAAAIIPAVTAVPAPSPQSAEIDVHLELSSKDLADFFDEHKAEKKDPATPAHHDAANHAAPPPGQSLPYPFILKGHLLQGLEIIGPLPPTSYYQFPKAHLGEQGIISKQATTFKLHEGKLLIADKAVGLHGPFEKRPVPAVLVHPHQGLNFTAIHLIGSEITTLRFVDQRFTFLGPKFVSGIGDGVDVGLQPRELNPSHFFLSFPFFRYLSMYLWLWEKKLYFPPPSLNLTDPQLQPNSNLASPNYHYLASREGWWEGRHQWEEWGRVRRQQ